MTTYDDAVGYDAAIPYIGGTEPDLTPSRNLRFEVAFTTDPYFATPAWVDLSSRVHLPSGITIRRGRGDEFEVVQTGTMALALENLDGALSPDNASSPFYPNVLPQRRCRLTYRDPATYGTRNIIAAEDASFEGGSTGSWGVVAGAAIANDTAHADVGTKAMRITWPTGGVPWAQLVATDLSIGRVYTVRARVWSATGVPDIKLGVYGLTNGTATSTKNAFATISHTFTATSSSHILLVVPNSSTTAGQQTWVDAVMLDETPTGTTMGTFTTTSPDDVVLDRFDGRIDRWPIEWPDGGQTYSRSVVTATDLLATLGARAALRSVVAETIALDEPVVHFPLGEPEGSTTVSDVAGSVPTVLTVRQIGSGGAITFGSATGVPTDGGSAPEFAPVDYNDCKILDGPIPPIGNAGDAVVLEAAFRISAAPSLTAEIASLYDSFGNRFEIYVDTAGRPGVANLQQSPLDSLFVASPTAVVDGQTHTLAGVMTRSGGTTTLKLKVDGVEVATTTGSTPFQAFTRMTIGGLTIGYAFTGTISHVAAYRTELSTARALEHRLAQTTGFAGERSDQRLARVATWIGLPAERCAFDVGNSTSVGHINTNGLDPLTYMRKIEATEAGILFAGTDGRLTFLNRARSYSTAAPTLSLPVDMLDPSAGMAKDLQLVANDVTGAREGGASVRMVDQASVDAFGPLEDQIDVVTTTDDDVAAAVGWRLNMGRRPLTRFTQLDLDAFTDRTYSPPIRSGVDVGARIEITGMPSQAPTSTLRQVVQGYTETITDSSWSLSVNATPYGHLIALVLDDPVYGALDTYPLAY